MTYTYFSFYKADEFHSRKKTQTILVWLMFGYIKIMVGPAQTPDPGKVSFSVV